MTSKHEVADFSDETGRGETNPNGHQLEPAVQYFAIYPHDHQIDDVVCRVVVNVVGCV